MHDRNIALSDRVVNGVAWRAIAKMLLFMLRFAVLVVLARLLPVDAFGILGLSLTVTSFASIFAEVGMMPALIQSKEIYDKHVRVAFTLSMMSGALLTSLVWLCAPAIANFFQAVELAPVLQLMSFTFLFKGVGTTAEALLRRKLDFQRISIIDVLAYFLGFGVVGISLAYLGYGVWALAFSHVTAALLETCLLIKVSRHTLKPSFAFRETRNLLRFGAGETLNRVVSFAASQGDYFVIGRWLGSTSLGLYSRAYNLMVLPVREFNGVVNNVLFPAYAEIQSEPARLKRAFLSTIAMSTLVIAPVLAILVIAAPDLINGLFGPKWAGTIAPLQILCIGGIFRSHTLSESLALAKGAVYAKLWRQSVYALLIITCSFIGSRWGITGVACGVVCALAVFYLLMLQLSIRLIGSSWKETLLCMLPGAVVVSSIVSIALPITLLLRYAGLNNLLILASTGIISVAAGIIASLVIPVRWYEEGVLTTIKKLMDRGFKLLNAFRAWLRPRPVQEPEHLPAGTTVPVYSPPES